MSEYTPAEVMTAYGITKPSITDKITDLAKAMNTMAATDMGNLRGYQAALFHTACDAINELAMQLDDRKITSCDCCGHKRPVSFVICCGLEIWACDDCREFR